MNKPKYANYSELAAAFKSGELEAPHYFIRLDKGGADARLCYHNPALDDGENDRRSDACMELFNPAYGRQNVTNLYEALGIPAKWY